MGKDKNTDIVEIPDPPEDGFGEVVDKFARALSVLDPGLTILAQFVRPYGEARRDEWLKEFKQTIEDIQNNREISIEDLKSNEEFCSLVLRASQIAIKTHQEEKIKALKNALYNFTGELNLDFAMVSLFLGYVDEFSEWHVKILNLARDPVAHAKKTGKDPALYKEAKISQLANMEWPDIDDNLVTQVWRDLTNKGPHSRREDRWYVESKGPERITKGISYRLKKLVRGS